MRELVEGLRESINEKVMRCNKSTGVNSDDQVYDWVHGIILDADGRLNV